MLINSQEFAKSLKLISGCGVSVDQLRKAVLSIPPLSEAERLAIECELKRRTRKRWFPFL